MSQFLHLVLASLLVLMGGLTLRQIIKDKFIFDLFQWSIVVFCLYGGLGVWTAFYYDGFRLPEVPEGPLFVAYSGVFLFAVGILTIRHYVRRNRRELDARYVKLILLHKKSGIPAIIWALFIAVWIVRLKMAADYNVFFSGTFSAERVLSMPTWLRTADALISYVDAGLLFWLCSYQMQKRWTSLPAWTMILIEMFWFFVRGRRWMMTFGLIIILTTCVYKERINLKTILVTTAILAAILFVSMPMFQATRSTFGDKSAGSNVLETTVSAIGKAYEGLWEDEYEGGRRLRDVHSDELKSRPLVFHYNWEIAGEMERSDPMYGWALLRDVLHAYRFLIPEYLFDYEKELGDVPASEQLIQRHFGWEEFDTDGNWPAVALADFGLIGCFFYGLFFGLILWVFERLIAQTLPRAPVLAAMIFGTAFYSVALADVGPEGILNALRAMMVIMLGFWAFSGPKRYRKSATTE